MTISFYPFYTSTTIFSPSKILTKVYFGESTVMTTMYRNMSTFRNTSQFTENLKIKVTRKKAICIKTN